MASQDPDRLKKLSSLREKTQQLEERLKTLEKFGAYREIMGGGNEIMGGGNETEINNQVNVDDSTNSHTNTTNMNLNFLPEGPGYHAREGLHTMADDPEDPDPNDTSFSNNTSPGGFKIHKTISNNSTGDGNTTVTTVTGRKGSIETMASTRASGKSGNHNASGNNSKSKKSSAVSSWVVNDNNSDINLFEQIRPRMPISWPFELDDFQKRAVRRVHKNQLIFVAAHTSAGKTVVAEYATARALQKGRKCIYTSPIKALSNQKYREFIAKFGSKNVGLITGDVSINPEGNVLIVTTEILRTMIYHQSPIVNFETDWVIFDEIHYLNDYDRGVVWEEVIILLPKQISLVMLSATVSNVEEFGAWVGRTRGRKLYYVKTEYRPTPLVHKLFCEGEFFNVMDNKGKFNDGLWKSISDYVKAEKAKKKAISGAVLLQTKELVFESRPFGMNPVKTNVIPATEESGGDKKGDKKKKGEKKSEDATPTAAADDGPVIGYTVEKVNTNDFTKPAGKLGVKPGWMMEKVNSIDVTMMPLTEIQALLKQQELPIKVSFIIEKVKKVSAPKKKKDGKDGKKILTPQQRQDNEHRQLQHLLLELKAQDRLPCTCFVFSRKKCLQFAKRLLSQGHDFLSPSFEMRRENVNKDENINKDEESTKADGADSDADNNIEKARADSNVSNVDSDVGNKSDVEKEKESQLPQTRANFSVPKEKLEQSVLERRKIETFLGKVFSKLAPEDRRIPQVELTRRLALRGIGFHHSGLLPFVKEVVEMLFSNGLIKVLFATETFAMGVNMPARSVIFTSFQKHDGTDFRTLLPSEYTQMAGRAGRRGLDKAGYCYILAPDAEEMSGAQQQTNMASMMLSKKNQLKSQFRITYKMILSLAKHGGGAILDLIAHSFLESNRAAKMPSIEKEIQGKRREIEAIDNGDEEGASKFNPIDINLITDGSNEINADGGSAPLISPCHYLSCSCCATPLFGDGDDDDATANADKSIDLDKGIPTEISTLAATQRSMYEITQKIVNYIFSPGFQDFKKIFTAGRLVYVRLGADTGVESGVDALAVPALFLSFADERDQYEKELLEMHAATHDEIQNWNRGGSLFKNGKHAGNLKESDGAESVFGDKGSGKNKGFPPNFSGGGFGKKRGGSEDTSAPEKRSPKQKIVVLALTSQVPRINSGKSTAASGKPTFKSAAAFLDSCGYYSASSFAGPPATGSAARRRAAGSASVAVGDAVSSLDGNANSDGRAISEALANANANGNANSEITVLNNEKVSGPFLSFQELTAEDIVLISEDTSPALKGNKSKTFQSNRNYSLFMYNLQRLAACAPGEEVGAGSGGGRANSKKTSPKDDIDFNQMFVDDALPKIVSALGDSLVKMVSGVLSSSMQKAYCFMVKKTSSGEADGDSDANANGSSLTSVSHSILCGDHVPASSSNETSGNSATKSIPSSAIPALLSLRKDTITVSGPSAELQLWESAARLKSLWPKFLKSTCHRGCLNISIHFERAMRKLRLQKEIEKLEYHTSEQSLYLLHQLDAMARTLEIMNYIIREDDKPGFNRKEHELRLRAVAGGMSGASRGGYGVAGADGFGAANTAGMIGNGATNQEVAMNWLRDIHGEEMVVGNVDEGGHSGAGNFGKKGFGKKGFDEREDDSEMKGAGKKGFGKGFGKKGSKGEGKGEGKASGNFTGFNFLPPPRRPDEEMLEIDPFGEQADAIFAGMDIDGGVGEVNFGDGDDDVNFGDEDEDLGHGDSPPQPSGVGVAETKPVLPTASSSSGTSALARLKAKNAANKTGAFDPTKVDLNNQLQTVANQAAHMPPPPDYIDQSILQILTKTFDQTGLEYLNPVTENTQMNIDALIQGATDAAAASGANSEVDNAFGTLPTPTTDLGMGETANSGIPNAGDIQVGGVQGGYTDPYATDPYTGMPVENQMPAMGAGGMEMGAVPMMNANEMTDLLGDLFPIQEQPEWGHLTQMFEDKQRKRAERQENENQNENGEGNATNDATNPTDANSKPLNAENLEKLSDPNLSAIDEVSSHYSDSWGYPSSSDFTDSDASSNCSSENYVDSAGYASDTSEYFRRKRDRHARRNGRGLNDSTRNDLTRTETGMTNLTNETDGTMLSTNLSTVSGNTKGSGKKGRGREINAEDLNPDGTLTREARRRDAEEHRETKEDPRGGKGSNRSGGREAKGRGKRSRGNSKEDDSIQNQGNNSSKTGTRSRGNTEEKAAEKFQKSEKAREELQQLQLKQLKQRAYSITSTKGVFAPELLHADELAFVEFLFYVAEELLPSAGQIQADKVKAQINKEQGVEDKMRKIAETQMEFIPGLGMVEIPASVVEASKKNDAEYEERLRQEKAERERQEKKKADGKDVAAVLEKAAEDRAKADDPEWDSLTDEQKEWRKNRKIEPHEFCAVLSMFIFHDKVDPSAWSSQIASPFLHQLKRKIVDFHGGISNLQRECGVAFGDEDWEKMINIGFVNVAYWWASGSSFLEICQYASGNGPPTKDGFMTNQDSANNYSHAQGGIQEGIIVRTLCRLEESLRKVKNIAVTLEHGALEDLVDQSIAAVRRDIVFQPSLYLLKG